MALFCDIISDSLEVQLSYPCQGHFWFDLILWHINHFWLFNAKSIFIYICVHIVLFTLSKM